jgi:hypothetical protein
MILYDDLFFSLHYMLSNIQGIRQYFKDKLKINFAK